jgi:6,7-dimethyl-8-ribityllumazine synthase
MATSLKNLSNYDSSQMPDGTDYHIGIIVAEWNVEITGELYKGALQLLIKNGVAEHNIIKHDVPGTFELTLGAQLMAENYTLDAIIALGCVIQGETPHFDYICQGVTYGITQLNMKYDLPVIFGVLTTNNLQQAKDRAGGKHGNKGDEAAITALKMVELKRRMRNGLK